ncbi:MAG: TonB-dependent siderophore receptor [Pseudomonadota bacterium]
MMLKRYTLALLVLATCPALAQSPTADEDPDAAAEAQRLEEIFVFGRLSDFSALKSAIPIMETARSISIETERQIIDKGALDLGDTASYTAGVTANPFGLSTRIDTIFVRGLEVPLYRDSLQSLFGNYNNARPDVYTVEQVEILKGPTSVLFGKGSPGGLVNAISKRPRDEYRHEIVAEYGNYDRQQIGVDSTGPLTDSGDWLYRAVALYRDTDTQVDEVFEKTLVLFPSVSWRPSDVTELTLLINYTDTEGDTASQFLPIEGTLEPAPNGERLDFDVYLGDPNFNRFDTKTTSITLLGNHELDPDWRLELTSRYTDGEAKYRQAWPSFVVNPPVRYAFNPDGSLYKNGTVPREWFIGDATSEQWAADVRLHGSINTGPLDHQLMIGAQYQDVTNTEEGLNRFAYGYNFITGQPDNTVGDTFWINVFDPQYGTVPTVEELGGIVQQPDTDSEDLGVYVSDQISLDGWTITLGLRYDDTETDAGAGKQSDDELSAGAGVLYRFDNGLAPYISYAESFEPVIGDNGLGAPLKPQKGEQLEIGLKYEPENFPALVTLAWFDLEESNLPDPQSLPGFFEQQTGKSNITGAELEAQMRLGDVTVEINASVLDTEDPNGFHLASVPEEQASSWVGWRPQGNLLGFKAGAGVRYTGSSWDGIDAIKTPSYTLGDLMLGWEFERWDAQLNVRNITDKEFYATCLARGDCFVGKSRTIVASVKYVFQ